jgi:hypothetical protein
MDIHQIGIFLMRTQLKSFFGAIHDEDNTIVLPLALPDDSREKVSHKLSKRDSF